MQVSRAKLERWRDIDPCDDNCYDYEPGSSEWTLNTLRRTLASFSGLDPDKDPDNDYVFTGPWWEEHKVNYPINKPRVLGPWTLDQFHIDRWRGYLTQDQLIGRMCPPGEYTRLYKTEDGDDSEVWMSDTPAEILGHLEFVWSAHGRVLINGLGLGVALNDILKKDCVTHVDVVEIDPDVIKLIKPFYSHALHTHRLTVHEADAFKIQWPPNTRWEIVYSDIWPTIGPENLPGIQALKRKYASRSILHFLWEEDMVRIMAKEAA